MQRVTSVYPEVVYMEQHTAEVWVKVISIVGIVCASIGVLVGLGLTLGGSFLSSFMSLLIPSFGTGAGIGALIGSLVVVFGIFILIIAAFEIYLYVSLMKYKNWARIVVLVFTGLGVLGALFSLPSGIVGLILSGGIFYLLAFQKEIVALFTK
jgi:hypothetical protein